MKAVIVVRKLSEGRWGVDVIGTDDPFEAMEWTRGQEDNLAGARDVLHAFKIEDHDGTPVFVPVGQLDPVGTEF